MNSSKMIAIFIFVTFSVSSYASTLYNYLCGGDEDGCDPAEPLTCICVASDLSDHARCFAHDQCVLPDAKTHQCTSGQIDEQTQARCLATLWQSEPTPPCVHLYQPPTPTVCAVKCKSISDCKPSH